MGWHKDGKESGSDGKEGGKDGGSDHCFLELDYFLQLEHIKEIFTF